MNNLKIFLLRNYGSMKNVGEELRLNEATVRSWCEARPRNMMKYLQRFRSNVMQPSQRSSLKSWSAIAN